MVDAPDLKSDYDLINYDFSTKTYVVVTQKNHLIIMFKLIVKKILTFYTLKIFLYL